MLTFTEARAAVDVAERPSWPEAHGTFYVVPDGHETPELYIVGWGAREWLADNDPAFMLLPGAFTTVDKVTGEVTHRLALASFDIMDAMTPVTAEPSPWQAVAPSWSLSWSPTAPHLTGSPAVVDAVLAELRRSAFQRLTPTSCEVPSTPSSSAAVLAVLRRIAPSSFELGGDWPTFESLPGRVY